MKSTKYGLQQFPSCQIERIGLAEKGIHFIQKTIKSLVVFNYSLYVYENNAITIRPCKMQSSKPYKFKDTVGLSFLGGLFCCLLKCSNSKSFLPNSCQKVYPQKHSSLQCIAGHCIPLRYSWHANYEGGDLKTFDSGIQWQLTKRKYTGIDTILFKNIDQTLTLLIIQKDSKQQLLAKFLNKYQLRQT